MLRLRTLGLSEIHIGDRIVSPDHAATFLLLLLVALRAPRPLSRLELAELLWFDALPPVRNHRLRSLLHRARQAGMELECTETTIRLPHRPIVDFRDFITMPRSIDEIRRLAANLGPILPGVDGPPGTAIAARLEDERDVIRATVVRWVSAALGVARHARDWPLLEELGRAGRIVDPFNEEAWLGVAEATRLTANPARVAERGELPRPVEAAMLDASSIVARRVASLIGRARDGSEDSGGGALLVWGPRGSGKTRLLRSIQGARLGASTRTISYSARGQHVAAAMMLVLDLAAHLLEEPGAAGCDPVCYASLRAAVRRGAPVGPPNELADAFIELVDALADEATTVILVDDMPLVMTETARFWSAVLEASALQRVAWVFTSRAEDESELSGMPDEALLPRVGLLPKAAKPQTRAEAARGCGAPVAG
jgi:hypothetical protein